MVQRRHHARFMLKLFPKFFVTSERLLQRDRMTQTQIDRFVNRTHATSAEMTNDSIAALQDCVRLQECRARVGVVIRHRISINSNVK